LQNRKLQAFKEGIRGKKVAVLGMGISNTPLIQYLARLSADVTAFDRAEAGALSGRISQLEGLGVKLCLGEGYLGGLRGFDVVFKTPVVRPDIPELEAERARGAAVTSEMEVFLQLCPSVVFGVTGSDGKTTTSTLICEMLKASGFTCHLGGNIGTPLLPKIDEIMPGDMTVVELSSFQLQAISGGGVSVAVVTNVSPNHLDVHKSYGEYVAAKKNIFARQGGGGLCVLNYDDAETRGMAAEARGRLGLFSLRGELAGAGAPGGGLRPAITACVVGGRVVVSAEEGLGAGMAANAGEGAGEAAKTGEGAGMAADAGEGAGATANAGAGAGLDGRRCPDGRERGARMISAQLMKTSDIRIPGAHNVANCLAAICAVWPFASREAIVGTAMRFGGVEHRIEHVRTLNGARYYNDSSSSGPTRTIACLKSFPDKVILIAGGKDKALDYSALGEHLARKVKLLVLCGPTSEKIKKSLLDYAQSRNEANKVPIVECESLAEAVRSAWRSAVGGDTVVLSPASTSFDSFRNFEERGRVFKQLVGELPGE
jgi:UDP-N-acetylmuramoylalanine-D-glutamate ligase